MKTKQVYTSGYTNNSMYVSIQAVDYNEAKKYMMDKYHNTPYNVLGVNKRHSFEPCHYTTAERLGLGTYKTIVRRYSFKVNLTEV